MLLQRNQSTPHCSRTMSFRNMRRSNTLLSNGTMPGQNDDPLSNALRPPRNESEDDRQIRLLSEAEAKKRSEEIDKQLKEEASKQKLVKMQEKTILLLGQAEAGKTTIVKQMRMLYEPARQASLRSTWTEVIFLNVIMAVKMVVTSYQIALHRAEQDRNPGQGADYPRSPTLVDGRSVRGEGSNNPSLLCQLRLAPLLSLELDLRRSLGAFAATPVRKDWASAESQPASFDEPSSSAGGKLLLKAKWQDALLQSRQIRLDNSESEERAPQQDDCMSTFAPRWKEATEHGKMQCLLAASIPEIEGLLRSIYDLQPNGCAPPGLWRNDSTTYFLDNLFRFTEADYVPTDDDILRARVRTIGVYEERFAVNRHLSYRIVDVGGSVSQRNVWAQFFSDATAIIFLAPISAFDEYLTEDPRKNKIKDSLEIWEMITASKILRQVSLILFLNKIDILKAKLAAGTMVNEYFTKYSGSNSFDEVWRYFRSLFVAIASKHQAHAPLRNLYIDKTTATSTRETHVILTSCQDIILRQNLKEASLT